MQKTALPEKTTPDNNFGPDYNDYDIPDDPDKNPSAIPEPTTFVLMALGAGVVSALKKLKQ